MYLWRNVIPHLTAAGRVVADDLIGFGKSEKPEIEYRFFDHRRYLEGFIDALGLSNIILVGHDYGGSLAFDYAARHPANVAGLAFFETFLTPVRSLDTFPRSRVLDIIKGIRTGTENDPTPGSGWDLTVNQNLYLKEIVPALIQRALRPEEVEAYEAPFRDPASRKPMWRWDREMPVGGEPADVDAAFQAYGEYLKTSAAPKLFLHAAPGALCPPATKAWVEANVKNVETVDLGEGIHHLQEDHPHAIGNAIARWAASKL